MRQVILMDHVDWMDPAGAKQLAEMLARQGAAALRRWANREPPLDVMRLALGL